MWFDSSRVVPVNEWQTAIRVNGEKRAREWVLFTDDYALVVKIAERKMQCADKSEENWVGNSM